MNVSSETDFKFLSIFADNLPHSWFEIIYLGTIYLNTKQAKTEKLLYRAVIGNGWIVRVGDAPSLKGDKLKLTAKGDLYYREMAIRRGGEHRYYKHFNRQQESDGFNSFGLDKFSQNISAPSASGFHLNGRSR